MRQNPKFSLICVWQNVGTPRIVTCWMPFSTWSTSWKHLSCGIGMRKRSRLLLYVSYVLMSEWAYLCLNTIRRTINSFTCQPVNFCKFFSKYFNTKSGLSIHQLPTLPQKIDSREGLFWGKKGLVVNVSKMNTHCIKPQFAPHFGLFAAKCGAICR